VSGYDTLVNVMEESHTHTHKSSLLGYFGPFLLFFF